MSEFKTYDRWLESPYHREPVEVEDRDDDLYESRTDKEIESAE